MFGLPTMVKGSPNPPTSGMELVAEAVTTPGSAFSRSRPSRITCATPAVFSNRGPFSAISIVSKLCASNPGLTDRSAIKVRISSEAPTSNTSANETSLITSAERTMRWRMPLPAPLLLSFIEELRSGFEAASAGISPNKIPVSSEMPSVNSATRPVQSHRRAVLADARNISWAYRQERSHAGQSQHQSQHARRLMPTSTLSVSNC